MRRALIAVGTLITAMAVIGGIRALVIGRSGDVGIYVTSAMLAGLVTYIVWKEEA